MSTTTGIVAGIEQERADQATFTPRTDKRPSGKQIYFMAHLLCDVAGLEWPTTSAECSDIIGRLKDQAAAVKATQAGDVAPPEFAAGF